MHTIFELKRTRETKALTNALSSLRKGEKVYEIEASLFQNEVEKM